MAQREGLSLKRKQPVIPTDPDVARALIECRNRRLQLYRSGGGAMSRFTGGFEETLFAGSPVPGWEEYGRMWQTATPENPLGSAFFMQARSKPECDNLVRLHGQILDYLQRHNGHIRSENPFLDAFRRALWNSALGIERNLVGFLLPSTDRRNVLDDMEDD